MERPRLVGRKGFRGRNVNADSAALGGPVGVTDGLRNATALGDLVTVTSGPVSNRLVLVTAAGRAAGCRGAGVTGRSATRTAAHPGTGGDERVERLAQPSGIGFGKVDRVTRTVQGELHGPVRLLSVQIVDESGDYPPRHNDSRSRRGTAPSVTRTHGHSQLFR